MVEIFLADETHHAAGFINTAAGAPSPFIWKQCSPPDGPMRVGNLTVAPSPIVMSKTKDTTISVGVEGSLGAAVGTALSCEILARSISSQIQIRLDGTSSHANAQNWARRWISSSRRGYRTRRHM